MTPMKEEGSGEFEGPHTVVYASDHFWLESIEEISHFSVKNISHPQAA